MSAHYFGGEVKETKRYKLGRLLGGSTRHFLLMTATPHSGKRGGLPAVPGAAGPRPLRGQVPRGHRTRWTRRDLMRRLVKEKLLKFDGTPLFPERRAYTVNYALSDARGAALQAGDRLRPRGDEPRRPAEGRRRGQPRRTSWASR